LLGADGAGAFQVPHQKQKIAAKDRLLELATAAAGFELKERGAQLVAVDPYLQPHRGR
jgi:hypothetical protein